MTTEVADFAPDELLIKVPRGAAWSMEVDIADTDVTGKTLYGYVRESVRTLPGDYVEITVDILVAGPSATIKIGQTSAEVAGDFYINMKDTGGQPTTILLGTVFLKEIGQVAP